MFQQGIFQVGMVLDRETFSILKISPPFIINVIFSVLILIGVLYFRSESWKGKLWNVVLMCYALLFIFVYIGAWFVRLKYNLTPSFNESFALEPFPGWKIFFKQWIENGIVEPNLTANAIAFGALLFYFRKFKGKYTWILRLFAVIPVSLFFIIYIPKVFSWLLQ
ncbi:conserved membrane hypothetical protein [Exiguobacterium sp. 8H]|nr:conserved membrane hypothetical protein [Exiguobacterium sp. 8H]VXB28338.1 conserved membrane hypothetical protein [Exiguobacterium sp. 8A]